MVGLVMLMRYSRTHSGGGELYLASTAVLMMEVRSGFGKMPFDVGQDTKQVGSDNETLPLFSCCLSSVGALFQCVAD